MRTGTTNALSASQARRLAVAAAGLDGPRPSGRVDVRHLRGVLERTQLLQLDSVNVVARAHELVLFSRLGAWPTGLLHRAAYRDRELFEYWAHEASLVPVALHPLLRWRMARAERGETWGGPARVARERPELVAAVLDAVTARGPLRAGELEEPLASRGPWWDRSATKLALEWLFWTGRVTAADRVAGFQRRYDLVERVLPSAVLAAPTPTEEEAHRALLLRAAGALGVATPRDLADYFRIHVPTARSRVRELVEAGALVETAVEGWKEPGLVTWPVRVPRSERGTALLAPFDPLVWERARAERVFGFRYRIEIYVPAPLRVHGYYVLPFLHDGRLVARVDVKADRAEGVLRVRGSYAEAGADRGAVAAALGAELGHLARWLRLDAVTIAPVGDLADALAASL